MIAPLLVLALAAFSLSQEPPRIPVDKLAKHKRLNEQSAQQKAQPAQTPPPVTIIHPEKSPAELQQDREDRDQDRAIQQEISNTTRALFYLSVITLAGTGIGLWITWKAARAAENSADAASKNAVAAERAAVAAKTSAKTAKAALLLTERAYLSVDPDEITISLEEAAVTRITFKLRNFGRTPARLVHIEAECDFRPLTDPLLPDPDEFFRDSINDIAFVMIEAGHYSLRQFNTKGPMRATTLADLKADKKHVYVAARVIYEDVFGKPHPFGFAAGYVIRDRRFAFVADERYTYNDDQQGKGKWNP